MISIIIPAHNEESVIARGLRAILTGADPGELEVIVSCNGCTDRTVEIARSFGPAVRVLEISTPSKIAALNAADEVATAFPRFYIDADVVLDLRSIRLIRDVLLVGDVLFATPLPRMDLSRTTWPVRAFYHVWLSLPYNREHGAVGTGVYAVSRAGRARWGAFPPVIADDGFVRFCFAAAERATVTGAVADVLPPFTLAGLLRIKTRSRLGQFQLRAQRLTTTTVDAGAGGGFLRAILPRPHLWLAALMYIAVNAYTRRSARGKLATASMMWERDDSRLPPRRN